METAKGKTREEIINRLADRIDTFEKYSQPHSRLIAALASRLARRFGLSSVDVAAITEAAMLHDIGLWAMSPAYHSNPGPLGFEARLDLWRHPVIGEQQMVKREAGRHAQLLVRWHHEWWNGSGYPDTLGYEDIPIAARIIRAVELFASLICDRPYRNALVEKEAIDALTASAGIECDPYVVKALIALVGHLSEAHEASVQVQADVRSSHADFFGRYQPPLHEPSTPVTPDVSAAGEMEVVPAIVQHPSENLSDSTMESIPAAVAASPDEASQVQYQLQPAVSVDQPGPSAEQQARIQAIGVDLATILVEQAQQPETDAEPKWCAWKPSAYNKKSLLGFQASVLRQLEFRSLAIPFWTDARLDYYLKIWGKLIFANDPRAWAATTARARIEAVQPVNEDIIARALHDVYVPGVKLGNPALTRWFSETDAWWMDNLRRNVETLEDPLTQAQVLTIGLQTGDYALSFNDETRELRRPLTTVFWRIAGRDLPGASGNLQNRTSHQHADEFIKQARADLLFLSLPSAQADQGSVQSKSAWREAWITGESPSVGGSIGIPQSKQSYLAGIERMLRSAPHFRIWAIEYQEPDLASAQDILDLIKEYRPVKATYSKDVTEVAGGQRSVIIVAERPAR